MAKVLARNKKSLLFFCPCPNTSLPAPWGGVLGGGSGPKKIPALRGALFFTQEQPPRRRRPPSFGPSTQKTFFGFCPPEIERQKATKPPGPTKRCPQNLPTSPTLLVWWDFFFFFFCPPWPGPFSLFGPLGGGGGGGGPHVPPRAGGPVKIRCPRPLPPGPVPGVRCSGLFAPKGPGPPFNVKFPKTLFVLKNTKTGPLAPVKHASDDTVNSV